MSSQGGGEGGLSEGRRRFLRAVRLGGAVTLGLDGRPRQPDDPLSGLVGGSAEETAEAGSIVDAAQHHANDLVRSATLEAASIRERARETGYGEGYEAGARQARSELAEALALVQRVSAEGAAIRHDLIRRSEREMVEMVIAAIRSIIGDLAADGPEVVRQTVRQALDRAGAQNVVRVRVHPDQVTSVLASLHADDADPPPFELLPDGSVGVGGCIVDTAHGRVDARLDVQLDAIASLLRDALPVAVDPLEEAADAA